MNNRSNCYYNNAYSNYYDDIPDVQRKEDYYEAENETFVDDEYDEYFQNLKYQRNRQNQILMYGNSEEERCLMRTDRDINSSASVLYTTSPIEYSNSTCRLLSATSTPTRSTTHLSRAESVYNPVRRCLETSMENKKRSTSVPGRKACARVSNNKGNGTNLRRSKSSLGFSHQKLNGKEVLNKSMSYVDSNGEYYPQRTHRQDIYFPKSNMAYPNQAGNSIISLPVNGQTHGTFLPKSRYTDINSSFSLARPLGHGNHQKNMAVIPPTYARKPVIRSFEMEPPTNVTSNTSASSPLKISWLKLHGHGHGHGQSLPMCTLRISAVALLISSIISCLLCFHMISERGKSYELDLSLLSSFVSLFLGVPCFRFEQWRWLPNRNYVSGYIVLSIFGVLQMMALFFLSKYPYLNHEITDVTKGALSATSALSIALASLGICTSCCCKYPPPDNRVAHAAEGFTV